MFAAIYIPDFSLQAVLRADPELRARPVALVDPEMTGTPIVQTTSVAAKAGVIAGLTPAQASARCRDLLIKTRSQPREQSATEILLQTAYAFSPNIESTALGGLHHRIEAARVAERIRRAKLRRKNRSGARAVLFGRERRHRANPGTGIARRTPFA
jgi:impB/mucB/samB family